MSRLLNALRHLQQTPAASDAVLPHKVTPRLSASIRKAVLGAAADATLVSEPPVLFRVPDVSSVPSVPDPVRLVEQIEASISSLQHESATSEAPSASVAAPGGDAPVDSRRQPTPGQLELDALLANERQSLPYRNMLSTVRRDVAGIAAPVVAIVGLDGQEATEHVAAALGTLLAGDLLAGDLSKPTLLIDANVSRELTERFDAAHASGLCELLAGKVEVRNAVIKTSHAQLDVVPFGQATAEQAQLLPQALAAEIEKLRTSYGTTVIDSGSLSTPWALSASQAADAVYLIVRLDETSSEHATACVQRFRAAGGKLTGCIAVGRLD